MASLLHVQFLQPCSISSSSSSFFTSGLQTRITPTNSSKYYIRLSRRNSYSGYRASWQELVGVLVFSAIPFTAVKAIANSPLGEYLQKRMMERKKSDVENSSKFKALAEKAREKSIWYGEDRPRWLGPFSYEYPTYLTGDIPGDYGFDWAGLGKDPVAFKMYFNFEILHARWAMLGALGALIPELLNLLGTFQFVEPVWWRVGYSKLQVWNLFWCFFFHKSTFA